MFYFGGNGRISHLMCSGAVAHQCWNGTTVDAGLATCKIAEAVIATLDSLPEFDEALRAELRKEASAAEAELAHEADALRRQASAVESQVENVVAAVAAMAHSDSLASKLRELEAERDRLELASRDRTASRPVELPPAEQLRALAVEAFEALLTGSAEAARLAWRLLPRLELVPYRICDGEAVEPRAHLTLDFSALVPNAGALEGRLGHLRRDLVVALFDPPQRVAFRERVVALRASGLSERQVAAELGLTITPAQRAAKLDRRMRELGLTDPYVRMIGRLEGSVRSVRHLHPRYKFTPLEGWLPYPHDVQCAG